MRKTLAVFMILVFCELPALAVTVSVDYLPTNRVLINPFIGSAAWADDPSPREQPFTLVYANLRWAELEPEPGVYDFDAFEEASHFDKWRAEGKRLILRFVMDLPGEKKHMDIPKWLYDLTGGDGKHYKTPYGRGYCPDYGNTELIAAHDRAIRALGARYDGDPFLAFVQLGSLGHWGEWHVHEKAGTMPDEAVRDRYAQAYLDSFSHAKLMMRRPFRFAERNGLGLFNDMAGDPEATETWLDWITHGGEYGETGEDALRAMPDGWKTAPIGGERAMAITPEELLGENLERTLSLLAESHASWIGPGSFVDIEQGGTLQSALDQVSRALGYRLRVSNAQLTVSEDGASLALTWENDGSAPFYFDWKPVIRVTDQAGAVQILAMGMDLADILPGVSITVETGIGAPASGAYDVEIAILDPNTGEPGVALAMETPEKNGWYHLLSFT